MSEKPKIIVKIDPEIQELIPKFLQRMNEKLKSLEEASAQSDFLTMAGFAHRIKGSAKGYGFLKLTDLAAQLEECAEKQQADETKALIQGMADFLERVEIVYEN